ncbi:MAG: response regulator [Deferrisomatales bacterium]|nr:response regulator [Deferrisomatales bacterium]
MNKVLIVDDEDLVSLGLARVLRRHDRDIRCAKSAEEALEALAECPYGLCFLDVRLPGMSGLEALAHIRERSPHTRIAMMSAGYLSPEDEAAISRQAHYFVGKPFDVSFVRSIAEEAMGPPPTPGQTSSSDT